MKVYSLPGCPGQVMNISIDLINTWYVFFGGNYRSSRGGMYKEKHHISKGMYT
jgi:hypothetical protein